MMSNQIIVGAKDCPISKVVSHLKSSSIFSQFQEKWDSIAIDLDTNREVVRRLRKDFLQNTIGLVDLVYDLIEEWVGRESENAKLEELIRVLEFNGLKNCADTLLKGITEVQKRKTSQSANPKRKKINKYCRLPSELQEFHSSSTFNFCILHTLDIEITCEKLIENVENHCLHDYLQFADIFSNQEERGGITDIVKNCTMDKLEKLYRLCDKADNKVVLVTSEKEAAVIDFITQVTFLKNQPQLIHDNMEWDDLAPSYQLRIIENLEEKHNVKLGREQFDGQLLVDLINGREVKLFKETFPEELSYYVERTVSTRNYISIKIFEQNSPDIFLLTGIDRYELSKLAKSKITDTSSNQLQQPKLTVKFMIMDQPHHFEKIAKKCRCPVHLILHNNAMLQWIKSKGSLNTLQKYVDQSQNQLHEDDFVSNISSESNQAVIISDSPGMGKSVLLGKIGRRLERKHPERSVFFIVLSEFIRHFRGVKPDKLMTTLKEVLVNMLCENLVGKSVLKHKLDSEEISVELLLDGLDEVDSAHLNLTYSILQTISSIKSSRFWVTSRPHLLEELEIKLNVFGHNINPFDENNQVKFLTSYWSRDTPLNQIKLETFAKECLQNLKTKMDSKDHDITGIPLQCYMLGYIFEDEAIANEKSESASLQPILITNITDLYKKLIDKKFAKYFTFYATQNILQRQNFLMEMHVKYSQELIYPEDLNKQNDVLSPEEFEDLLKVGIVESSNTDGSPRFLHRTFAEYILAWSVVDKLGRESSWNETLTDVLFERVLRCEVTDYDDDSGDSDSTGSTEGDKTIFRFAYPVITYFINALVVDIQEIPPQSTHSIIKKCANPPDTGMKIVHACVQSNCTNIVKMLHNTNAFGQHAETIFSKKCLLLSIEHAELPLVTFVLSLFEHHHEWAQVGAIQAEVLLHAIARGHFAMVEFLLKEKGLLHIVKDFKKYKQFKAPLHICVEDTRKKSASEIEERAQILRLLVGINHQLLEEEKGLGHKNVPSPLLSYDVHVKLLMELVRLGANVFARDTDTGSTILHASDHLDCNEYHTFLSSLSEDTLKTLVQIKNKRGHTPLMSTIETFDPLPETFALFKIAGAEFNFADSHSVLNIALYRKRSTETLKTLIKYGSHVINTNESRQTDNVTAQLLNFKPDMKWTPISAHMWTLVILGQEQKNVESELSCFKVECANDGVELDLNYKDEGGNSLLHLAAINLSPYAVTFLWEKTELDINSVNNKQQNVLHRWAEGTIRHEQDRLDIQRINNENLQTKFRKKFDNCRKQVIKSYINLKLAVLKHLIEHCVDVYARDETGQTFLHYYIHVLNQHDNFYDTPFKRLVEYLVEKGHSSLFEISGGDNGHTPLHLLFLSEYPGNKLLNKTLNLIRSSGVNFNVVDNAGNSVLYYVIMKNYTTMNDVSRLIRNGADWKFKDNQNNSVLHLLAQNTTLGILKLFLGLEGLNVNGLNADNNTPLHFAVQDLDKRRILKKCQSLVENGADINIRNTDGDTPLSIALKRKLKSKKVLGLLGSTHEEITPHDVVDIP